MSYDGLVLNSLINDLQSLVGAKIQKILQPSKDEIHLHLYSNGKRLKLLMSGSKNTPRLHLIDYKDNQPDISPSFCMFLRKHIMGGVITKIEQLGLDRVVLIHIKSTNEIGNKKDTILVHEIMGRYSNIILINDTQDTVLDSLYSINKNMSKIRPIYNGSPFFFLKDNKINIINQDFDLNVLINNSSNLNIKNFLISNFSGFSPIIVRNLILNSKLNENIIIHDLDIEQINNLNKFLLKLKLDLLNENYSFNIYLDDSNKYIDFHVISLDYYSENIIKFDNIHTMLNSYYNKNGTSNVFDQKKQNLTKIITDKITKSNKKLSNLVLDLKSSQNREILKIYADLLMSNQYVVKRGQTDVRLSNFFDNNELIDIPLDPRKDALQNAQYYYKKYSKLKKANIELKIQIDITKNDIQYLNQILFSISNITSENDFLEVHNELAENNIIKINKKRSSVKIKKSLPLHYISSDNYDIYIGKNNKQNDELTMKIAQKNDLFFHIKDFAGPHVIVKLNNQEPTQKIIEEAAFLAAYYSKINEKNILIDYTKRKNIKKPNGSKPGMVFYTNHKTINVDLSKNILNNLTLV